MDDEELDDDMPSEEDLYWLLLAIRTLKEEGWLFPDSDLSLTVVGLAIADQVAQDHHVSDDVLKYMLIDLYPDLHVVAYGFDVLRMYRDDKQKALDVLATAKALVEESEKPWIVRQWNRLMKFFTISR